MGIREKRAMYMYTISTQVPHTGPLYFLLCISKLFATINGNISKSMYIYFSIIHVIQQLFHFVICTYQLSAKKPYTKPCKAYTSTIELFLGFRLGFTAVMSLGQWVCHPKTARSTIGLVLFDLRSWKSHKTYIWTRSMTELKMGHRDLGKNVAWTGLGAH